MPNRLYSSNEFSNYNQKVDDLMDTPPSWLIKSGISLVAFVVFLVLMACYLIKYPDKISGTGILTSATPPIEIISNSDGYIDKIFIEDSEIVADNTLLLEIKNSANSDEIGYFQEWIGNFENIRNPKNYLNLEFPENLQLGAIQNDYAQIQLKFSELQQNLKNNIVFKQINSLTTEIANVKALLNSQEREKKLFGFELHLAKMGHNRNVKLHESEVISDLDLEEATTQLLQKERQFEQLNTGIIKNNIKVEQLEMQILALQDERQNLIKHSTLSVSELITRVKANIHNWKRSYTITAPIGGKLSFVAGITENTPIKAGSLLGYIVPETKSEKYISAQLPIQNIGKVEVGQKALIKLDAYPYKEYGMLISEVAKISAVPEKNNLQNSMYELKIPLLDSLYTNYQKLIDYRPNMTAKIEIITDDKSILERIFNAFGGSF